MKVSMQWAVPAIMGARAVLTWAHNNDQERRKERSRLSAQYVNPFMSACEDLQSRIYKIMELNGLDSLRERYPDGSYAEETLYLLVRFFGGSTVVNRYGPYTQSLCGRARYSRAQDLFDSQQRVSGRAFQFLPA